MSALMLYLVLVVALCSMDIALMAVLFYLIAFWLWFSSGIVYIIPTYPPTLCYSCSNVS